MPWTIDNALENDTIHIVERDDAMGFYSFTVGTLSTVVTVEVSRLPNSENAAYRLSHCIHSPTQATPYRQSRPYWDDVPYALHRAISSITDYYREAVRAGHTPAESWLVPN